MRYHRTHKFVSLAVAIAVLMTVSSFVYADETDVEEEPVVDTSVVEDIQPTEEPEETEETTESAEPVESVESEEIDIEEEIVYEETVVIDNGYDNDFLAEQFIAQRMSAGSEPLLRSYNYASQLSDYNLILFTALQPQINAVANGTKSSTIFVIDIDSFTAADLGLESITTEVNSQGQTVFTDEVKTAIRNKLGLSTATVIDALLNACPYDLYWYDKTAGCSVSQGMSLSGGVVSVKYTLSFSVAQEYAGSSAYTVDTSMYGQALTDAVVNARAIIDRYAADSDYDKLSAYRNEICSLASYNDAAADRNNNTPYGNPWQMIWVFDGDPNTTVVCEGYSKAFQFLCDNSDFRSDDIYAICVSGPLYTSSGSGGHMWNIVHMEDGNNYLVDVTNCDTGHALFLRGWSEYPENSGIYQVSGLNLNYGYDIDTLTYYNPEDLTLNTDDYDPSSVVPTGVEINSTSFPDEIFRNWVSENCDSDSDGYLSSSEISAVTEIVVTYKDIRDLTGIEYFTELVRLDCSDNLLTSLDVSHNTKLEYLNVSTYFMKLYQHMTGNQITSLDLSNNPNLTYLNCSYNALTSLDLRNNPLLTHLEAESYNYLVSGESDYVRITPPLTSIDISNNSLLEYVDLAMNELTSLDLSGYTHLEYLRCDGNDLYELNVDGCTNLKELNCCDNDLTGIDVRSCSRLESLGIALNPMPHLDVNGMTSLKRLTGYGCGMITIDISGCSSLMYLDCHRNSLSIINVSDSPLLVCAYVNGDYSGDSWDKYSYNAGSGDEAVHYEIMANTGCIIKVSELVPGWDTADGHDCYVNPDGTYATGVQTIEGSVYCFADDGVMFTDGWVTVNGARYYCQSNGKAYVNTTQVIDGVTYVFDNQGKCVSETPVVSTVNMYRLYNPNSGEHFYTSNAGERDLLASLGWHDEGIGWIAPAHSNTPVYRLYNENGGEHHYTTSVAERDMLVSLGWNDEGIGWYSDDARSVPLYRQYNPNAFSNNHNYTTSPGENDWLVSIGWQAEGVGWYGVG